jgi:hypothetical protein
MSLSIYFEHDGFAGHICGSARDFRSCHPARSTPGSPEIDQNGNARIVYDFVEQLRVSLERLVDRRQNGFARATSALIGQMGCGNSILTSANLAGPNHWHLFLPTVP